MNKIYDVKDYNQIGGGKCSLCHSEGTNKSTCPLHNAAAHRGNPLKHPLAMQLQNPQLKGEINVSSKPVPKPPISKPISKSPITKSPISKSPISKSPISKSSISKSPVLQQESLAAYQLKQLPIVESIILSMHNMDDVDAFCSTNKKIQETCKQLFDKDTIKKERYGLSKNKKDTPIVSHIKTLMKIKWLKDLEMNYPEHFKHMKIFRHEMKGRNNPHTRSTGYSRRKRYG